MTCGRPTARTGGPVREDGGVDGDVTLQHARERAALLRGRCAKVLAGERCQLAVAAGRVERTDPGPRHVGGAVEVLA